jgi:mannose-6-phosphate isomerase-like protein (cupin superfamily)
MKKGYYGDIEKLALENENFRQVLYTAEHCQLVLMSLLPGEEIGLETHTDGDQFFRFERGEGKVVINETEYAVSDGDSVIVPSGAQHNVMNTSATDTLKLYTIYAPAHHKDGVVRKTRAEAIADGPEFDGVTTEI